MRFEIIVTNSKVMLGEISEAVFQKDIEYLLKLLRI
jgi:hypothetical protein